MTLAENASGETVFVESIVQGGNAEKSGKVAVGDIIAKCAAPSGWRPCRLKSCYATQFECSCRVSATVLKAGKGGQYKKEGYGQVRQVFLCSSWMQTSRLPEKVGL